MTLLSYSRLRLQIGAWLFTFSALSVVIRWWATANVDLPLDRGAAVENIQLGWIYPLGFLIAASTVGRMLVLMSGDLAAIRALPDGLEVTSFFGRKLLRWDGVLGGHRVNYGNILHRNRWFNIRYLDDGSVRSKRVPLILTKRPSGGQMSLPAKIDQARDEAMRRTHRPSGEAIEGTGFDADAAIQRYLRTKAEEQAEGSAPAPTPPSRPPVRPAFGRKQAG